MAEPLAVRIIETGADLATVAAVSGIVIGVFSLITATAAIYVPLHARRAEQREAQLTFRNLLHIAYTRALACTLPVLADDVVSQSAISALHTARDLLDKLDWSKLRPGPMTVDFAEVYVALVDIGDTFARRPRASDRARLQAAHNEMVPAMGRIDAKLRSRANVRFEGDIAWYRSRFEL